MLTKRIAILLAVIILSAMSGPACAAQEFYYDLDSTYVVTPSDARIAIQFDTIGQTSVQSEFFAAHACLNPAIEPAYLQRGF